MKRRILFIPALLIFAVIIFSFLKADETSKKDLAEVSSSKDVQHKQNSEVSIKETKVKPVEKSDKKDFSLNIKEKEPVADNSSFKNEKSAPKNKLMSQRKKRMKGYDKADSPDLFREWEVGIRTKDGQLHPGYDFNYKVKEFNKISSSKTFNKFAKTNALSWEERGPGNVSGRTRGIIVDPDDPNFDTWYVGSVGGGVWKTTNAGQSWVELTADLPNLSTSTLAMAESNHDIIYAGTGEGFFNVDQMDGSGIWKSTDRGNTWNVLSGTTNNPEFENITRIILDPNDENILLVSATQGFNYNSAYPSPTSGIHRSTDGGNTWTKVYNAGTSSVEQIIANPLNFNTQYASINSVGVIKSTDGGLTWNDASNGIGAVGRLELAIAPTDTNTVYFSAEGGESGSILYVTDDGGENWFAMTDTTGNDKDWLGGQGWYDNTIAVDPYDENKIYVGGINLWRLERVAGTDTSDEQVTGVDFENTQSFFGLVNWGGPYAGGGIGKGSDFLGSSGVTQDDYTTVEIRFGSGLSQKAHRFRVINGNYIYQDYVDVPFEVWDTDNNIQLMFSFRDWANDGAFDLIPFDGGNPQREYMFINAIPYNATTPDPVISGNTNGFLWKNIFGIWPILSSGGTWDSNNLPSSTIRINWGRMITQRMVANVVTDGYGQYGGTSKGVHVDHHNILLVKTNEMTQSFRLVNGNDGGVSFSDDKGANFDQPTNGYNTTQFYGIDKMNGADRYIGGTQDNGSWLSPLDPDATSTWEDAPSGDGFEAVWHYNNPDLILESSQYNNIFKSTDGGVSWNSAGAANGLTDQGSAGSPFFTKIAKSKQDPDLVFAVGTSGVWRSDDFASSWTKTAMPTGFNGTNSFSRIKISLVNPQIVWTGQGMSASSRLFVSTDGGLSFNVVNNHTGITLGRITSLETDPVDDSTAYALFSFAKTSKILKTTDLGQTWTDISGFGTDTVSSAGFPDVAVLSLLVMPFDTDKIWAGTEIGIFETTDGGANWYYADNGFPATAVYEMVIVNDEIVIATHGRGVWTVSLPELAGYEPPAATLSPRLSPIAQNPSGLLVVPFSLRSAYDSSQVVINSSVFTTLGANASPADTTIYYPVTVTQNDSVQIISYKDGIAYKSYKRISNDKVLAEPQNTYVNQFNSATTDFAGTGFSVTTPTGFSDGAIHTAHPYSNNSNPVYQLLVPIIVAASNATINFDEIAIIEPGDPGSVYGDDDFWDYVIVEGTKDGVTWESLLNGYDAREDTAWLNKYNASGSGDSTLFRNRNIDMAETFNAGDTVLIRFRLFADAAVNGWGWAIDNLAIQGVVPVELTSFTVNAVENRISLSWQTASEKNNLGFEVQRSSDNKQFVKIGFVPGKGTTSEKQSYSFTDNSTNGGKFQYRLKQIDLDGSVSYSNIVEVSAIPTVFTLSQNYPNPFNPTTTIKFSIPKQEKVVLEIFSSLGERVTTLVNEIKDAGFYELKWNGTNNNNQTVSTGVYIYRITAGSFVQSKKMMFLK